MQPEVHKGGTLVEAWGKLLITSRHTDYVVKTLCIPVYVRIHMHTLRSGPRNRPENTCEISAVTRMYRMFKDVLYKSPTASLFAKKIQLALVRF